MSLTSPSHAFREVLKREPNNEKAEDNLGLSLEGKKRRG
jgi:hypothetical protein